MEITRGAEVLREILIDVILENRLVRRRIFPDEVHRSATTVTYLYTLAVYWRETDERFWSELFYEAVPLGVLPDFERILWREDCVDVVELLRLHLRGERS
jgi:hypothetical protein